MLSVALHCLLLIVTSQALEVAARTSQLRRFEGLLASAEELKPSNSVDNSAVSVPNSARSARHPCIPKQGLTAIAIGQDFNEINAYTASFAGQQPAPFALMSYTALHSPTGNLSGTVSATDYGSGIQWLVGLAEAYPHSALQVGLWLVDQTDLVTMGKLDHLIDQFAITLNATNRPVYLRVGYEFDNEIHRYSPGSYKAAFQHIVRRMRKLHAHNVAFVWHAAGETVPADDEYLDWYPGDDVVDWCGVSIFQQPYHCQSADNCIMIALEKFSSFCEARHKPLMIAESAPFGGIISADMLRKDPDIKNGAGYQGSTWNAWFTPVIHFVRTRNVRLWSYINCNWDALPMYSSDEAHAPGVSWGDSRLQVHSDVKSQWIKDILSSKHVIRSYLEVVNNPDYCDAAAVNDDPADSSDDLDKKMRHTVSRELRELIYGFLLLMKAFFGLAVVLAIVVLSIQCGHKCCGCLKREHVLHSFTSESGRKKFEYVVIQDDH